jgi:nascent polypeptide-associated complex subunit alpha
MNRGEKKCRKALQKLGMKNVPGITRVALKKRDGLVFAINDPEVLKSATNENSYVVFGELKLEDSNLASKEKEAEKFKEAAAAAPKADDAVKADKKDEPEDDGEALNEEGLTPSHIDMVMSHSNCTRNQAIKALRKTNDDMVNAVMELTK